MNDEIRKSFEHLAAQPDADIPLDEAALLIASEAEQGLSVEHYLRQLDKLAMRFKSDDRFQNTSDIPVAALSNYIHTDLAFTGNVTDYYDPANSYLNRVMDHKRGIPITLALVHIAISTRLDIPVSGISFPGHFLVQYGGSDGTIVDPFSGRELSRTDCQNMLIQISGPRAILKDEYFRPASAREILIRVLDNLKQIFWRLKSWDQSKACLDRQLLLFPKRDEFNLQLGAIYEMQGNPTLAEHVYTQIIQRDSEDPLKQLASKRLLALHGKPRTIH